LPIKDKDALRAYQKAWNEKNRERLREKERQYYRDNTFRWKNADGSWKRSYADVDRRKEVARNYYYRNKDKINAKNKQRRDTERRHGTCPICIRENMRLVWEHDHVTGKHRGWVCSPCNLVLGHSYENAETLRRAIMYLQGDLRND
jgi:hypothetical protein